MNKTRRLFNDVLDHGLLSSNPFRKAGGGSPVNEERRFYVAGKAIKQKWKTPAMTNKSARANERTAFSASECG